MFIHRLVCLLSGLKLETICFDKLCLAIEPGSRLIFRNTTP